jgi:hypothetical protein
MFDIYFSTRYLILIVMIILISISLYKYFSINKESFQSNKDKILNKASITDTAVNAKPITVGSNNLFKFEIEIDDPSLINKVIPQIKFDNIDTLDIKMINRPIDCEVSEFIPQPYCSNSCNGTGLKGRIYKRTITVEPKYKGEECPHLEEKRDCNTHPCPIHCKLSDWVNQGDCSETCGGGIQNQIKNIITQPQYGGNECGSTSRQIQCNIHPCPVDCVISDNWTPSGSCSLPCGGGKQVEIKNIVTQSAHGGQECPAPGSSTIRREVDCNQQPCPVNCEVSEWRNEGNCSETCGGGTQSQVRDITQEPLHGGAECGPLNRNIDCNTQECPINCQLSEWQNRGTCSKTCGTGVQQQNRTILIPPQFGGTECGSLNKSIPCNTDPCPAPNTSNTTNTTNSSNSSTNNSTPNSPATNNSTPNTPANNSTSNSPTTNNSPANSQSTNNSPANSPANSPSTNNSTPNSPVTNNSNTNIEPFVSTTNDKYGCAIVDNKIVCTKYVFTSVDLTSILVKVNNLSDLPSVNNISINVSPSFVVSKEQFLLDNPDASLSVIDKVENSVLINNLDNSNSQSGENTDNNNRTLLNGLIYGEDSTNFNNVNNLKGLNGLNSSNNTGNRGNRGNSDSNNSNRNSNRNSNNSNSNSNSNNSGMNMGEIGNMLQNTLGLGDYYNSIKNDPCFKRHGYNKTKCEKDSNCMIESKLNACVSKNFNVDSSLSNKNINFNDLFNNGNDFFDSLGKMNASELSRLADKLGLQDLSDPNLKAILDLINNLLNMKNNTGSDNSDNKNQNKFTKSPTINNSISQKHLKGVGNIFSPRIIIKKKDEPQIPKPTNPIPRHKKFKSKNKQTLDMIDKHSSDYWLQSPNYCGNKIKCQRKGLEERISKNLNEKEFNNMYNILPHNKQPVSTKCIPQNKCLSHPVPTYNNNVFHNAYEYTGIGTILPKFNFSETYNTKDYS